MRIIDYYNYAAVAVYIVIMIAAFFYGIKGKKNESAAIKVKGNEKNGLSFDKNRFISGKTSILLFACVMIIAALIRLIGLDAVPYGLQQDEASIGYDAYCLATYGIDRNGYSWPVYPITWGCGGGSPLLIYLNVISISLFGTGIVKLRLIPAICGVLTVALFYLILRLIFEEKSYRNEIALFGAFFLAICPWHVILSRWSLDCNIMPFNLMLAFYLFLLGEKKRSTILYALSAAAFAVCMYSYGAATIVIPVFLLLICIYGLMTKTLSLRQLVISFVTFLVVFAPLLLFYCVNYLGLPEIVTPFFCVNKFTAARTGEAFISFDGNLAAKILGNLKSMVLAVTIGDASHTLAHYYPGYAALFVFTFPVTAAGFVLSVAEFFRSGNCGKNRELGIKGENSGEGLEHYMYGAGNAAFLALTLANVLLLMVILPDTSRMVMAFIPFIYFFIKGSEFVVIRSKALFTVIVAVVAIGAMSFAKDYFTDYNRWATSIYMPGYGEAISRAYEIAGDEKEIISTYDGLSSPFMLSLYYTNYDPRKFYTTVEYKDPYAEFRVAKSFGNFTFGFPEDFSLSNERYSGGVYVLSNAEAAEVDSSSFTIEQYAGYCVVY